jgi:hypothetical protein
MGQVIDLEQRRQSRRPEPAGLGGPPSAGWHAAQAAAYVDAVVLPSVTLWRSLVAAWACVWLAPLGLEVRRVEAGRPSTPPERASSTR